VWWYAPKIPDPQKVEVVVNKKIISGRALEHEKLPIKATKKVQAETKGTM
jgi:hypothetical protein